MCGRFTQPQSRTETTRAIGWLTDDPKKKWADDHWTPAYNVAPGTFPTVMHCSPEDGPGIDAMHWGYRPKWAEQNRIPMSINARIEKAVTGNYFRHMFRSGRVIVPAGGWYEWTGEKGNKQPWYIRLQSGEPMFLAAITNVRTDREAPPGSGFVIVTAAAEAGLVDVHDRRPVVFAPEDARLWMDPDLPLEQAEQLARAMSLGPDAFAWYRVSTDVNNARNNGNYLIEPLPAA